MATVLISATVSKVPFYIAGGVLVAWAVLLALLGLSRPDFPGRIGGARAVMAISGVLVAVTIAMSIHTSAFEENPAQASASAGQAQPSSSGSSSSTGSSGSATNGSTSSSSSTTSSSTTSSSTTSSSSSASASAAGKSVFTGSCGTCHTLASAGTSGTIGPNLDQLKPSEKCVLAQVTGGGAVHTSAGCKPYPGSLMPSFAHTLSSTQITAVAQYVSSVAGAGGSASTTSGSSGGGGLP